MAVLSAASSQTLCTAQTGNGDSTNTLDRGGALAAGTPSGVPQTGGAIVITSTIGATPTVTVNILGSADGTTFFNIPYSLVATPRTFVLTAITITTAVTTTYLLQELVYWRFLKLNFSANTNVTLTAAAYL